MPILGVVDSSKRVSTDTGAMFPLQVVTVGPAGASSVSFTNIPNTYSHLQVRAIGRTNRSANGDYGLMSINSDTSTSNYTTHYLQGNGSAAAAGSYVQSFGGALINRWAAANDTASVFGATIIDILDYANTNKYKTIRNIGAVETNTSDSQINLQSTVWLNTSAITSLTFTPGAGTSWNQYTQFALYAVKGA